MSQSFWRCQSGNRSVRSIRQGLTSCDTPPHLHMEQLNYTPLIAQKSTFGSDFLRVCTSQRHQPATMPNRLPFRGRESA